MDTKINFRVTKDQHTILVDEAKRQGISVSDLCRRQILIGSGISAALHNNELKEMIGDINLRLDAVGKLQAENLQATREGAINTENLIRKLVTYLEVEFSKIPESIKLLLK